MATAAEFWPALPVSPACAHRVHAIAVEAEARRVRADYDTGSILETEAGCLLALAEAIRARTVIEVGTFIGTSTMALAAAAGVRTVYTCDVSNDCLPASAVVRTYPKQTSTQMFQDLIRRDVLADLCFFDGALGPVDIDLLLRLVHFGTVYAFHDYAYGPKQRTKHGVTTLETVARKGIGNVRQLWPRLKGYGLVEPAPETTLALLVPEALL